MRAESLRRLYDRDHARAYDERFLLADGWARDGTDFELELIAELLRRASAPRWLDVGCGTGFYLSRFPDVQRAGLDLSPAMLELAASRNPGVELTEGTFLDPWPRWRSSWTLVSCMWAAYSYVDSLDQVEQLITNLAAWTAPDGCLFLPVCDIADLSGGMEVPYRNEETWVFGGELLIKATVWEWHDESIGRRHSDLIAPHIEHLTALAGRHFERIEIVNYPPYLPGWGSRRAIVAARPRAAAGDQPPATVVTRPPPPARNVTAAAEPTAADHTATATGRLRARALRILRRIERRLEVG
ncbi:MAG: methyltransferase domain-containing protein [Solirubrobacterales bacterium]